MAKIVKKQPIIRVSTKARHEIRKIGVKCRANATKPIAFRLPPDVVALADAASAAQRVSRNKIVEHVLRVALAKYGVGEAAQSTKTPDQFDLFG